MKKGVDSKGCQQFPKILCLYVVQCRFRKPRCKRWKRPWKRISLGMCGVGVKVNELLAPSVGQNWNDAVSRPRQQTAEIRLLSTVSTETGRSAANEEVFLVDTVRHQSDGIAQLVEINYRTCSLLFIDDSLCHPPWSLVFTTVMIVDNIRALLNHQCTTQWLILDCPKKCKLLENFENLKKNLKTSAVTESTWGEVISIYVWHK